MLYHDHLPVKPAEWQRFLSIAAVMLMTIFAAGCATPQARIRKHPNMFTTLSPEVQNKVEQGEVDIGFSKDAVFLALGRADRTYTRTTEDDKTLIWSYVREHAGYAWGSPYHRFRVTTVVGNYWYDRHFASGLWYGHYEREYEYLRIEFKDSEVISIERLAPGEAKWR